MKVKLNTRIYLCLKDRYVWPLWKTNAIVKWPKQKKKTEGTYSSLLSFCNFFKLPIIVDPHSPHTCHQETLGVLLFPLYLIKALIEVAELRNCCSSFSFFWFWPFDNCRWFSQGHTYLSFRHNKSIGIQYHFIQFYISPIWCYNCFLIRGFRTSFVIPMMFFPLFLCVNYYIVNVYRGHSLLQWGLDDCGPS